MFSPTWEAVTGLAQGSLDPAGPVAEEIAGLWWWLFGLGAVVYLALLAVFLVALARRRETDAAAPRLLLVGGGVAFPAVVLAAVLGLSLWSMKDIPHEAPPGALVVQVVGHQWWWEIRYPGTGVVTANEIHLPVGRPVALEVSSADVVHSFWVPELGGKIDALPDHPNTLVLQADEPGEYRGVCAEFCGLQHAKMNLLAIAQPQAEFERWLEAQAAPAAADPPPVFAGAGCGMCHTVRGTDADGDQGPDLTHVGGRRTLAAATLANTPEHLRRWIADPQDVKEGTQMEAPDLTPAELDGLAAYLESLR